MCHPSPHLTSCYRLHINLFLLLPAPVTASIPLAWNPLALNLFIFFLNQPTRLPPKSPQGHKVFRAFLNSQCLPSQGTHKHFLARFIASKLSEEYRNCEVSWKPMNWTRRVKDDSLVKLDIALSAFQKKRLVGVLSTLSDSLKEGHYDITSATCLFSFRYHYPKNS